MSIICVHFHQFSVLFCAVLPRLKLLFVLVYFLTSYFLLKPEYKLILSFWFEWTWICTCFLYCLFIYVMSLEIRGVVIPSTGLNQPHVRNCPNLGPGFPTQYVLVVLCNGWGERCKLVLVEFLFKLSFHNCNLSISFFPTLSRICLAVFSLSYKVSWSYYFWGVFMCWIW
jgi:hypothetical protein